MIHTAMCCDHAFLVFLTKQTHNCAAPHGMASRWIYIFKLGTNTHTCLHGHHISTAEDPTTLRSQSGHAPAQKNLCRQKRQWYAYSWKVLPSGFVHSVSLERALLSFRPHVYLLGPSPHLTCMVYTTACSEELRRLNLLFAWQTSTGDTCSPLGNSIVCAGHTSIIMRAEQQRRFATMAWFNTGWYDALWHCKSYKTWCFAYKTQLHHFKNSVGVAIKLNIIQRINQKNEATSNIIKKTIGNGTTTKWIIQPSSWPRCFWWIPRRATNRG